MTLPEDVIVTLRARHPDLAEAIVALVYDLGRKAPQRSTVKKTFDLVRIASRRFLITIDPSAVTHLPGCELVPFGPNAAILALERGRGLADLTLAVVDRLEEPRLEPRERDALLKIRSALRTWRRDPRMSDYTRSIVVMLRASANALILLWNPGDEKVSQLSRTAQWGQEVVVVQLPELTVLEPLMTALTLV